MRRNLFLFLALACFIGLLAIFVVDGYLGLHDTVYVTAAEQQFTIGEDYWQRVGAVSAPVQGEVDGNAYYVYANREEKVSFGYEVDNRQFSTYEADIEVSVWHSQQKVSELIAAQPVSIAAFDKGEWGWVVDNTELLPTDILPEQSYNYTVIIKRGEIERRIVVSISPLVYQ